MKRIPTLVIAVGALALGLPACDPAGPTLDGATPAATDRAPLRLARRPRTRAASSVRVSCS
ncbi:hypothetical protein [Streptacidiphilus jiangxiensis]|uniref:Uncharacterized protein n=1 Tax=Streptacidiphilus jiangxiensis TaxID=235985 RepID=A0A1H7R0J8_STRJI|nr:hypothetical protein [Streptacidiphilus jiangxiensis]SEL53087.1 hypothetical protein SAMN05414137_109287 [Streptacidiphilus jiangxiensis]